MWTQRYLLVRQEAIVWDGWKGSSIEWDVFGKDKKGFESLRSFLMENEAQKLEQ
jgi:hypothetical protein